MFVAIDGECSKLISLSDYIYDHTLSVKKSNKINNYIIDQLVIYMENIYIKDIVELKDKFELYINIFKYTLKISYCIYLSKNNECTIKTKAEIFNNQNYSDCYKIIEIKFNPVNFNSNQLYYNLKELKDSLIKLKNEKIKIYS